MVCERGWTTCLWSLCWGIRERKPAHRSLPARHTESMFIPNAATVRCRIWLWQSILMYLSSSSSPIIWSTAHHKTTTQRSMFTHCRHRTASGCGRLGTARTQKHTSFIKHLLYFLLRRLLISSHSKHYLNLLSAAFSELVIFIIFIPMLPLMYNFSPLPYSLCLNCLHSYSVSHYIYRESTPNTS